MRACLVAYQLPAYCLGFLDDIYSVASLSSKPLTLSPIGTSFLNGNPTPRHYTQLMRIRNNLEDTLQRDVPIPSYLMSKNDFITQMERSYPEWVTLAESRPTVLMILGSYLIVRGWIGCCVPIGLVTPVVYRASVLLRTQTRVLVATLYSFITSPDQLLLMTITS